MNDLERDSILVAVDFSPDSEAAFRWAARTARRLGVPLVVLHVVHDPASAPGSYAEEDSSGPMRTQQERATGLLAEFLTRTSTDTGSEPPLEVSSRLSVGLPATRIVEVAAEIGAQQIVVGSRGRTGLAHLILGSKAERVAQLSPIPVTIVKRERSEDA